MWKWWSSKGFRAPRAWWRPTVFGSTKRAASWNTSARAGTGGARSTGEPAAPGPSAHREPTRSEARPGQVEGMEKNRDHRSATDPRTGYRKRLGQSLRRPGADSRPGAG